MKSRTPFLLSVAALVPLVTGAQAPVPATPLPFEIGERFSYEVKVGRLGNVGKGAMWIEGPEMVRGVSTWRLRFELEAGKGPISAKDHTSSWLDPVRFSTLRYHKLEKHPLSKNEERVEISLETNQWTEVKGGHGILGAALPLDELSFIYLLRTLPLHRDTTYRLDRHFDAARNPVIVEIEGHERIETAAGIFKTRVIEMKVRDPQRYKGEGKIRFFLSDDRCRIPVRIESQMPVLGRTTLTLTAWSHPPRYPGALEC